MACHSCPARPRRRERRLAIIPATLAVTAGPDQWKACGNSDPAFAFLASGWKFTDDATLDGNYTIALGGAGQFEIAPRPLAVTADSFSRACGIANPPLIWTVDGDGLVNGDPPGIPGAGVSMPFLRRSPSRGVARPGSAGRLCRQPSGRRLELLEVFFQPCPEGINLHPVIPAFAGMSAPARAL